MNFKIKCDDSLCNLCAECINSFSSMFNRLFLLIWIVYAFTFTYEWPFRYSISKMKKTALLFACACWFGWAIGDFQSLLHVLAPTIHSLSIMQMKLIQGRPDKFASGLEEWKDSLELIRFDFVTAYFFNFNWLERISMRYCMEIWCSLNRLQFASTFSPIQLYDSVLLFELSDEYYFIKENVHIESQLIELKRRKSNHIFNTPSVFRIWIYNTRWYESAHATEKI